MARKCHRRRVQLAGLLLLVLLPVSLDAQQSSAVLPAAESRPKKLDWSAYLQVRYTGIEQAEDLYALRRFKLMFFGQLTPHVEYYAQGMFKDGNRSDTDGRPYLQEGWTKTFGVRLI